MKTAQELYVDHINAGCEDCDRVTLCTEAVRLLHAADDEWTARHPRRHAALAPLRREMVVAS